MRNRELVKTAKKSSLCLMLSSPICPLNQIKITNKQNMFELCITDASRSRNVFARRNCLRQHAAARHLEREYHHPPRDAERLGRDLHQAAAGPPVRRDRCQRMGRVQLSAGDCKSATALGEIPQRAKGHRHANTRWVYASSRWAIV